MRVQEGLIEKNKPRTAKRRRVGPGMPLQMHGGQEWNDEAKKECGGKKECEEIKQTEPV